MAQLLLAKEVNAALSDEIAQDVDALSKQGIIPHLAIIRVGEKPDDISYERGAMKKCEKLGIKVSNYICEEQVDEDELFAIIDKLNDDNKVHGILLLKPLPKGLDEEKISNRIATCKDVDGITAGSSASLYNGSGKGYAPCTASAVMQILKHYNIPLEGKRAVVLGRSQVIGKPVSMLLLAANCTVTITHSKTVEQEKICRDADIIIAAVGKMKMVNADFISENQVIIDVGIHMTDDGLCGDVDFAAAEPRCQAITPVPGGVGGVTTTILASHVVDAAKKVK